MHKQKQEQQESQAGKQEAYIPPVLSTSLAVLAYAAHAANANVAAALASVAAVAARDAPFLLLLLLGLVKDTYA